MRDHIRFWIRHRGLADATMPRSCSDSDMLVKIAVPRNGSVWTFSGGPTDEGYSYMETVYCWDGVVLTRRSYGSSRDCDGPRESSQEDVCVGWGHPIVWVGDELVQDKRYDTPRWEEVESSQRDYFAEAAGY